MTNEEILEKAAKLKAKTIGDDELDEVAGGSFNESMKDLEELLALDEYRKTDYVKSSIGPFSNDMEFQGEVQKIFPNYGIICKPGFGDKKNEYYDMKSGRKFKARGAAMRALDYRAQFGKDTDIERYINMG